jgi:membrane fusion protein (multidrug efflux system)
MLSLLLALIAMLCLQACRKKPLAKAPPSPMVEVATVTQADVPIFHEWIGVLDGLVNAQIRAQVSGYLLTQHYREGESDQERGFAV